MARVLWIPHHSLVLNLNTVVAENVVAFVSQSGLPVQIGFDLSKRPTDEALINPFTWEDATDCEFEEVSLQDTMMTVSVSVPSEVHHRLRRSIPSSHG